ncbi:MAG: glycerol acyltransferase, partial [Bacteroidia bacterium]
MIDNKIKISDFAKEFDFDDIRAFYDHEVKHVTNRLINDPKFMKLINFLWPEMTFDEVKLKAAKVDGNIDFQLQFMHGAIRRIVELSSSGLTSSGFEQLDPKKTYLFVANHRDILLDAAILQILLVEHGFNTSEITFGSNLKDPGFITDFGKLNRMFTVLREGTSKELYKISQKLSAYIRHTIVDKEVSVWIAQRNGRTKDGNDMTQTGLLKMLNMSGDKDFVTNFSQLNIVPISISFEYEPCDVLKVQESYLSSLHTKYVKAPGEDMNSILTGIKQPKGKIHVTFGKPILKELKEIDKANNDNEKIKLLTAQIDKQIYSGYKLNAVNYIAYDLLHDTNIFENNYSNKEKEDFLNYIASKIDKMTGEADVLTNLFLVLYSN